jgi:hypothetical protein
MTVCSKRGPSLAEGRGRWLVLHVEAKLGACGAGTLVASLSALVGTELCGVAVVSDLVHMDLSVRCAKRRLSIAKLASLGVPA